MPGAIYAPSVSIMDYAEHELAAFRRAAIDAVGWGRLAYATDIWIRTLESLDCPDEDFEKFFRSVTIQTAAQLAGNTIM
jgi:hypothetical protein